MARRILRGAVVVSALVVAVLGSAAELDPGSIPEMPRSGRPDLDLEVARRPTAETSPDGEGRTELLGTLGGLRPWLAERGLTLEIASTDELVSNPRGGLEKESNGRYAGLLDVGLTLDTAAAGLWRGGTALILLQSSRGRCLSEEAIGDVQVVSNIDAPPFTQVSEYWLEQTFLNDGLRLRLGRQDANRDFATSDGGGELLNSSFGLVPTVPLPTYPAPAAGLSAWWQPSPRLQLGAGLWDGASELGNGFLHGALAGRGGWVSALELDLTVLGGDRPEGRYRIGAWHHTEVEMAGAAAKSAPPTGSADGLYATFDQGLWESGSRRVAVFGQAGLAPGDRSSVARYLGVGLVVSGLLPGRRDDMAGVAIARAELGELEAEGLSRPAETAIEVFYRLSLRPWLTVQPDLQLVRSPSGVHDDALVVGVRVATVL